MFGLVWRVPLQRVTGALMYPSNPPNTVPLSGLKELIDEVHE